MTIIFIILLSALAGSIVFFINCGVYYYTMYQEIRKENSKLLKDIDRKYIKTGVTLQNAILEAYEQAVKKGNAFEEKAYRDLLDEIKSKW